MYEVPEARYAHDQVSISRLLGSWPSIYILNSLRSGIAARYRQLVSKVNIKRNQSRALQDLISIGPAMVRDFKLLGIDSVAELAQQNPEKLYKKLCKITGQRQDICVLDAFRAGIAQACNPLLPAEQCQWWYWSRKRKAGRT